MKIGDVIKEFRTTRKITQQEMADMCGVSKSYISLLESGKSSRSDTPINPSIEVVNRMAQVMGISVDDLVDTVDGDQGISLLPSPPITDADIKFALFDGDSDITDEQYEEVRRFARYIKERDRIDK